MRNRRSELLALLERSGPSLHALLTRLTLRQDVAEELMQELFIKLDKAGDGRKIDNWDAYAHRAAINLVFDWRRKQKRSTLALEQVSEPACAGDSPLTGMVRTEELEQTLNAISRLNRISRQALVMRYIQEQSYDHIARQLDKSPHQVRALCSQAMARLRDILKPGPSQSSSKEVSNVEN